MRLFLKKAVWTCALILTFILFFYTFSFAQTENIKGVQFKDGSIIYGRVIIMNSYDIRIETKDGGIIFRKFSDVDAFIKDTGVDTSVQMPKSSTLKMGFMFYHFDYKEDEGWLPGTFISYTFKKNSIFYSRIYSHYAAAEITYDGATQTGTPINFSNDPQKFFKLQWDFGYPWPIRDNFVLTPYSGMGYRYWERGEAKITAASYTNYKEVYSWGYIPVGLKIDYDINDRWRVGGNVAANFMFGGRMKAYLSEVLAGPDLDFSLGNEVGWYAELPVTYRITNNWALTVTPWYEYSTTGQSDTQYFHYGGSLYSTYEPSSKTNQFGISLSADLSF